MPEIKIVERQLDKDGFLVIACDGIWDCISNDDCVDMIRFHIYKENSNAKPSIHIEKMFDKIIVKRLNLANGIGTDNMTCILI